MQASFRKKTRPVYDFSEQVGHLLRRAYQRHVAIFQNVMPDSRLTGAQFCVLCALRDNDAISMSEICRVTAIDQATVRGIVERLKARDLITTSSDDVDRRKVIVALAAAGKALLEETIPVAHRISDLTVAKLNPAEQLALLYLLRKLGGDGAAAAEPVEEPALDALRPSRRSPKPARRARARA
jgi:DNA-binding MarR family transcriptional regulator